MIGIDSNILLRLFLMDSAGFKDAAEQFDLVRDLVKDDRESFFVNHVVIAETIWVLRQKLKFDKETIASAIRRLLAMANVTVHQADNVMTAVGSFAIYPGDFSDHLIGEINKQNGCRTTLTFDKAASKSPNFSELQR